MTSNSNSQNQTNRKKGPKLTKDGKITVFDAEEKNYGIRELIDLIRYIPEGQDIYFGAEMIKKNPSLYEYLDCGHYARRSRQEKTGHQNHSSSGG